MESLRVVDFRGGYLQARPELFRATARLGLAALVKRGWLRPVGVQGVYGFIPGAAAGPYPSGDPSLALRAVLRHHHGRLHVGVTSAAGLLGCAKRWPDRHIVVGSPERAKPRALRAAHQVAARSPAPAHSIVDGLPVPTSPKLFAEVARLAPRLALDSTAGWIRRLLAQVPPYDAVSVLGDRNAATRARAGYLADTCGAADVADAIAQDRWRARPLLGAMARVRLRLRGHHRTGRSGLTIYNPPPLNLDVVVRDIRAIAAYARLHTWLSPELHRHLQEEVRRLGAEHGFRGYSEHNLPRFRPDGRSGRIDVVWACKGTLVASFEIDSSPRVKSIQKLVRAGAGAPFWVYYGRRNDQERGVLAEHDPSACVHLIRLPPFETTRPAREVRPHKAAKPIEEGAKAQ